MNKPGSSPLNPGDQGDLYVAASPFLAMGILYALAGLLGLACVWWQGVWAEEYCFFLGSRSFPEPLWLWSAWVS
jgi:hypothetical protein